jgi:hypothetical protein
MALVQKHELEQPAKPGSTGAIAFFQFPPLPSIVAEWAALIPLVVHLASFQDEYHMIGEAALNCRLSTGLFPRLGYLNGIARLLRGGPAFLDRVSSTGTLSSIVWDVSWGSVFPCANGAARDLLTAYASRKSPDVIVIKTWTAQNVRHQEKTTSSTEDDSCKTHDSNDSVATDQATPRSLSLSATLQSMPSKDVDAVTASVFSRPQVLHIINCSRQNSKLSTYGRLCHAFQSPLAEFLWLLTLLGVVVILCLFGSYGTAHVVLSGGTSKIMCKFLPIQRPPGYLQNNESHDACMLTAIHENASTWYLYRGDRSVVDWVLNKTMIVIPQSRSTRILYYYFRLAHCHQLLAMTYVAAQKGWDGVCLLCLMIIVWTGTLLFNTKRPAAEWMQREKVGFEVRSFEFTGRTPMIGAVQMISDGRILLKTQGNAHRNTNWMDTIMAPCSRRARWTDRLLRIATNQEVSSGDLQGLDIPDQQWVEKTTKLSVEAAQCVESEIASYNGEVV